MHSLAAASSGMEDLLEEMCLQPEPWQKLPKRLLNHSSAVELQVSKWVMSEATKAVGDLGSILNPVTK